MKVATTDSLRLTEHLKSLSDCSYLEAMIVYYGAPTLQGHKPANLINIQSKGRNLNFAWEGCLKRLESELEVSFQVLKKNEHSLLLLVYRPQLVALRFICQGAKELLGNYGYPVENNRIEGYLKRLAERFQEEEMPHEVGLFLGYPPQDVCQFIRRKGACPKDVGLWCVYSNVGRARRKVRRYQKASNLAAALLLDGEDLATIRMTLDKKQLDRSWAASPISLSS